jgi:hypothetical protein
LINKVVNAKIHEVTKAFKNEVMGKNGDDTAFRTELKFRTRPKKTEAASRSKENNDGGGGEEARDEFASSKGTGDQ